MVQSIIGATEKRRESGAGCRGIGGIWIRGAKVGEFIRNGVGRASRTLIDVAMLSDNAPTLVG
ncbi:hypothetical protein ATI02_5439 [Pseudomonas baetica]|uniref:Uncharacterized protein n=1 Tax=Pseudomonas baetica TaxID=674054 RepID=A0ABX4Q6J5_9PSED|nr:hypothetical protein ATI02_5439 [Pseudomonas baetica]